MLSALMLAPLHAVAADTYPPEVTKCIETSRMQLNAPADGKLVKYVPSWLSSDKDKFGRLCWQDKNEIGGPIKRVIDCQKDGSIKMDYSRLDPMLADLNWDLHCVKAPTP